MYRLLLVILCTLGSLNLLAQEPTKASLAPCGSPNGISPWLLAHAKEIHPSLSEGPGDTLWVGVQVHLLAKDNGTGRFAYDKIADAICRLNTDFAASNIQFYLKNPLNVINRTEWYDHNLITDGIEMMLTNNVDSALNAYFVSDPAGNCGYNLPYGGVAISHACGGANDHTWAHEVGHALSLPHPFIGWEGKVYNYNQPTPLQLTYDYTHFHDTLDTQVPAPLDTALVEFVDGSNCSVAADLICDTKPDYLSYRWQCNAQHQSSTLQKDPKGVDFTSDGTLYMSYADDACQNRFSDNEIAIMRATLMSEKSAWIAPPGIGLEAVAEVPVAEQPVQDQLIPYIGGTLIWHPVPNATHYIVQASRLSNFTAREADILTTDTSVVLGQLYLNFKYYWRIKAVNNWNYCAPMSSTYTFKTAPVTSTYYPDYEGWRCYPSLLKSGQSLQLEIPESWRGQEAQARFFDVSGRLVWEQYTSLFGPKISLSLPSESWQSGLYYFTLTSDAGIKRQALFIER